MYFSAEVQSVYSTTPADWAIVLWGLFLLVLFFFVLVCFLLFFSIHTWQPIFSGNLKLVHIQHLIWNCHLHKLLAFYDFFIKQHFLYMSKIIRFSLDKVYLEINEWVSWILGHFFKFSLNFLVYSSFISFNILTEYYCQWYLGYNGLIQVRSVGCQRPR